MKRRPHYQRQAASKPIGRNIIIGCEDKKSGRYYFNDLRVALRLSTERVFLVPHNYTDPAGIVESVAIQRERRRNEGSHNKEDSAWAVFDGDEHILANPANWNTAIQRAKAWNIRLGISNPCIELWYLLHLQDQFADIHRNNASAELKRRLGNYDKSMRVYNHLKDGIPDAIRRAKQLQVICNDVGTSHRNPSTTLHVLVNEIFDLAGVAIDLD